MTIKLLLAIPLILFFMYVLALPKHQLLGKRLILVFAPKHSTLNARLNRLVQ